MGKRLGDSAKSAVKKELVSGRSRRSNCPDQNLVPSASVEEDGTYPAKRGRQKRNPPQRPQTTIQRKTERRKPSPASRKKTTKK